MVIDKDDSLTKIRKNLTDSKSAAVDESVSIKDAGATGAKSVNLTFSVGNVFEEEPKAAQFIISSIMKAPSTFRNSIQEKVREIITSLKRGDEISPEEEQVCAVFMGEIDKVLNLMVDLTKEFDKNPDKNEVINEIINGARILYSTLYNINEMFDYQGEVTEVGIGVVDKYNELVKKYSSPELVQNLITDSVKRFYDLSMAKSPMSILSHEYLTHGASGFVQTKENKVLSGLGFNLQIDNTRLKKTMTFSMKSILGGIKNFLFEISQSIKRAISGKFGEVEKVSNPVNDKKINNNKVNSINGIETAPYQVNNEKIDSISTEYEIEAEDGLRGDASIVENLVEVEKNPTKGRLTFKQVNISNSEYLMINDTRTEEGYKNTQESVRKILSESMFGSENIQLSGKEKSVFLGLLVELENIRNISVSFYLAESPEEKEESAGEFINSVRVISCVFANLKNTFMCERGSQEYNELIDKFTINGSIMDFIRESIKVANDPSTAKEISASAQDVGIFVPKEGFIRTKENKVLKGLGLDFEFEKSFALSAKTESPLKSAVNSVFSFFGRIKGRNINQQHDSAAEINRSTVEVVLHSPDSSEMNRTQTNEVNKDERVSENGSEPKVSMNLTEVKAVSVGEQLSKAHLK